LGREFLRAIFRERRLLTDAVLAFNFAAAAQIHPERLPEGPAGLVARRLLAGTAGVRRLSVDLGWILGGVNPPFCLSEFEDPRLRAALLPRELLEKVVACLGLAVNHRRISRLIARADVLALRAAWGADACEFALRRASFLVGEADWARLSEPGEGAPAADEVQAGGLRILAACFRGAPPGLMARLRLKLPKSADACFPSDGTPQDAGDAAWRLLRRTAIQELTGEWAALLS
jgi:hypothetical protein